MTRSVLVNYRAKVIEDTITIEGYANAIITMHYLGSLSETFFWDVLQNELFNNGLRISILEKVLLSRGYDAQSKGIIESVRRISNIRNYFAHCNTTRKDKSPTNTLGGIPHPKKPDQYLDFQKLYSEFTDKLGVVSKELIAIMDKMGVLFMHDTDTGTLTIICTNNEEGAKNEEVNGKNG